jgi:SURF1 family
MSKPHPPTSGVSSTVEHAEPAWNPGGKNLSYINKTGRKKLGVIGVILSLFPSRSLLIEVAMPITSFALGTWQVYRLKWKKSLIERYSENLRQPPIILPKDVGFECTLKKTDFRDHTADELDHRTVLVRGRFRHDQEMLVGPRTRDGELGYHVVTPIERDNGLLFRNDID